MATSPATTGKRNNLYSALLSGYKGKVIVDPGLQDRGHTAVQPDADIYLKEENPYILAHEIGHNEARRRHRLLHWLIDVVGESSNAMDRFGLHGVAQTLGRRATGWKERLADSNALDILRNAGLDEEELRTVEKRYKDHTNSLYFSPQIKTAAIEGLPDRSDYGDLSKLREGAIATLVRQKHLADKARLHEDMRIGDPSGLHSWAVPKFMPEDDSKRLAIHQPLHQWSYKDFQGRLGHGYGKGLVSKMEESPVVILKNTGDHIMFTRGDSKDAPIYNLRRTKDRDWILFIRKPDQPLQIKTYPKEHFKSVPMDRVPELIANGATVVPKIDGAGTLLYLGKHGVEAYGIRSNAQGLKPEYTDYIPGLRSVQVPKELQGKVIRGELFGQRQGRSIGANELSGILNSTLRNAAYKRQGDGIRLLVAALAVNDRGKDVYDRQAVSDSIAKLKSDNIKLIDSYSGDDALRLIEKMKSGDNSLTREGVVIHQPGKRPLKAKFKDDSDVIVRNIFPAETSGDIRAGGFEYSLPGSEDIIGRVGTGFDYGTLRDMLKNPDAYIGRTARIQSQEQYPSGAFRAPSFVAFKED